MQIIHFEQIFFQYSIIDKVYIWICIISAQKGLFYLEIVLFRMVTWTYMTTYSSHIKVPGEKSLDWGLIIKTTFLIKTIYFSCYPITKLSFVGLNINLNIPLSQSRWSTKFGIISENWRSWWIWWIFTGLLWYESTYRDDNILNMIFYKYFHNKWYCMTKITK